MWNRLRHAFRGMGEALRSPEILGHLFVALIVVVAGFFACLDAVQWALMLFAIGLVLVSEIFNTAIEEFLNTERVHTPTVRRAKDLAAAAVLVAALVAAAIGILVFGPLVFSGTLAHCLS